MVPVDPHFAVSPAAHGDSTMSSDEIVQLSKKHTIFEWTPQAAANPVAVARAEGIYFWTPEGKRFIDFNSQLMCSNIGHSHPRVVKAIQDQAATLAYANPFMATEPRARLGAKLAEIAPGDIDTFFFTNGGAEAVENAIRVAGRPNPGCPAWCTSWIRITASRAGGTRLRSRSRCWKK